MPKFAGFRILYQSDRRAEKGDEESEGEKGNEEGEDTRSSRRLPTLANGDALDCQKLTPEQHFTEPPPRYTEATIIRALEEQGIGRPSTYAR